MKEEKGLINRVANSGLVTLNLEDYFPETPVVEFDIKDFLFKELILKEKDFRASLKALDWNKYQDQYVAVCCTADAIVPVWAYMLVVTYLSPLAKEVYFGTKTQFIEHTYQMQLKAIDGAQYEGKRIVIKGCSNQPVPVFAYVELTRILRPYAQSIMYGEPCSTVPIFKKPRPIKR